ncbi:MAG TPA: hypothetical protein EYP85_03570 [Armatimonadetes bacterium]|nr:hypothetical protein [Armatimonadota bacterium]
MKEQKLQEALREAVYRQGVLWFASWDLRAFPRRGNKPFHLSPQFAQRLPNGNTLICETWDVVEVTPELDIVWQFGEWAVAGSDETHLNGARSAWYDEETNTVLIADTGNHRLLAVDRASGQVVCKIEGLGPPASAFPVPGRDTVLVAEAENHWVYEVDWEGTIRWSFGARGESGTDACHLRQPWFAHPAKTEWGRDFDGCLISDYGNHRVLLVRRSDKAIVKEVLSTGPELALQTHHLGVALTGQITGMVLDQDWDARWYLPHNWRIVPTPEGTYLLFDRVNLWEVDPRVFGVYPTSRVPGSYRLLTHYEVPAGRSVGPIESEADLKDVPPIPTFTFPRGFTLYLQTTAEAQVEVLTARHKWSWAPSLIFDGWVRSHRITARPGTLASYTSADHHCYVSLQITMSSEPGQVDAWVSW